MSEDIEKIERDSFVFYRSFFEAIAKVPDKEDRANIYDAICEYALNGNEIERGGIADIVFPLIRPQLEANNKRYMNGRKPKVKQTASETEAKPKQTISKTQANVNDNDNVNDNVNVNENNIEHWFETFWNLYPRKVSKKKSFEKFKKACKDEKTFNEIIAGLKQHLSSRQWNENDGQFIPHPTTWLNGERWKDEMTETAKKTIERREDYDPIGTGQDDICF